jgi:hypothetical protein
MREPFRLLRLHRFLHEDQIRDKLGVVTRVLQDSRHLNACVLVQRNCALPRDRRSSSRLSSSVEPRSVATFLETIEIAVATGPVPS